MMRTWVVYYRGKVFAEFKTECKAVAIAKKLMHKFGHIAYIGTAYKY